MKNDTIKVQNLGKLTCNDITVHNNHYGLK